MCQLSNRLFKSLRDFVTCVASTNVFSDIKQALNATYDSDKFVREALFVCADVVRVDLFKKLGLKGSPALADAAAKVAAKVASLPADAKATSSAAPKPDQPSALAAMWRAILTDTSTDNATIEELLVYFKSVIEGKASTDFIGIRAVPDGKANTLVAAIKQVIKDVGQEPTQVAGFCADGASVNTGATNGVMVQLTEDLCNFMISVHCSPHRLALGSKDASETVVYLEKTFKSILEQLFVFYSKSAKRWSHLKEVQLLLDDTTLKLVQNGDTRWLRCLACLS